MFYVTLRFCNMQILLMLLGTGHVANRQGSKRRINWKLLDWNCIHLTTSLMNHHQGKWSGQLLQMSRHCMFRLTMLGGIIPRLFGPRNSIGHWRNGELRNSDWRSIYISRSENCLIILYRQLHLFFLKSCLDSYYYYCYCYYQ